ncbi:MAG TPA: hypothetical protein VJ124_25365 [Pyrinomonadaceae bacterium]|nr:hypothetical protein [Pyrinomonadaceae bacterium]
MKKFVLAMVILFACVGLAAADTIYLRDGRTVRGTLLGFINGRFAVRLADTHGTPSAAQAEAEIVFFRPGEVERIEIDGRSLDDLRFETRTIQVSLGPNWIDSGLDLRRNERVQISASGTIVAGRMRITPEGLRWSDPNAPLPRAAEGLLIGAVGSDADSPILELGLSREFVSARDGRLYLTVNRAAYTDARGAFTVQVRRERDLASLRDQSEDSPFGRRDLPGRARTRTRVPIDSSRERRPQEITVDVPGTSRGTDTNIEVQTGDQVTFTATGMVIAGKRVGEVGPEGGRTSGFGSILGTRPVPSAGPGALIGYIRQSNGQLTQPFLIGSQLIWTAPAEGRLVVAINDDDYSDNSGSFRVQIRR